MSPIQFSATGDGQSFGERSLSFSNKALKQAEATQEAFVYYNPTPISTDKLIAWLKQSDDFAESETESRKIYENDRFSLEVSQNGSFCLFPQKSESGVTPLTLSDKECRKIAQDFLTEYGLFCDDLVADDTVGEDKASGKNGTVVVGKVITYHPKTDNDAFLFGNSKVSVRIGASGEVTEIIYNHVHYENKTALTMLDPESALAQAKAAAKSSAIYFEAMDEVPQTLTAKTARLAYYENVKSDTPSRQPVYLFEGGSGEEAFVVAFSAVKR